ncbi:MAG: integrase core domain-containing protein [Pseudonocardiaceae bacterium]
MVERFFGTLKYEYLYRADIADGDSFAMETQRFRQIYNTIRPIRPSTITPPGRPILTGLGWSKLNCAGHRVKYVLAVKLVSELDQAAEPASAWSRAA